MVVENVTEVRTFGGWTQLARHVGLGPADCLVAVDRTGRDRTGALLEKRVGWLGPCYVFAQQRI